VRRAVASGLAFVVLTTACVGGTGPGTRQISVDYSYDEFASFFIANFPSQVTVRQGDQLVFQQTWTGEPHTVTGGRLADEVGELIRPFLADRDAGREVPDEPPDELDDAMNAVGWAFGDEEGELNQTLAQPCYVDDEDDRKDGRPCRARKQPEFDGTQLLYSSGVIPYDGPQGNEFRVRLADDIDPGRYFFYCAVHGPFQRTDVEVKPRGSVVPSADATRRSARRAIERMARPLLDLYRDATDRGRVTLRDPASGERARISGNFAGLVSPEQQEAAANEFIPKQIRVRAGEKITWNVLGKHTITFGVPEYLPIITFARDGTVRLNPKVEEPAGGAPTMLERERESDDPEPVVFDAGTYDGEGFWSSGTAGAEPWLEYSMRISEPGTYRYACLIHPPMVGTVVVTR
jgi:plastocyanin